MIKIGLIGEGGILKDNRVALTPAQCKWIQKNMNVSISVQCCNDRCFRDNEYINAGIDVKENISDCDIFFGIKEVPINMLVANKTYLFFSHTKKLQPYNRELLQEIIKKKITLIDYECLEHDDGTRIIGFGFFAGVVGAHNGLMAYGRRTGAFSLERVYKQKSFQRLIHTYFGLKLPLIKIAVTGNGKVAHGILEIMNLMEIHETEPDEYLEKKFEYPVYVHLKGVNLYRHKVTGTYTRKEFHEQPENYECIFKKYISETDILLNGVYWQQGIPRLFEIEDMKQRKFKIKTIADISDDRNGSIPCNIGNATIESPLYGVSKTSASLTDPYLQGSVDVMAVGNLPNELPRDASRYFGEQLIKFVLEDLLNKHSKAIKNATIVDGGKLTKQFNYMKEYASP